MQTKTQHYYATVSTAKRLSSKTCEGCKKNIQLAESAGKMVLMGELLYLDKYGLVKKVDTHAIRDGNL